MLMLDRRAGQSVDLKDRKTGRLLATVKILEVLPSGVVRVGFDADQNVHIQRDNMKNYQTIEPPARGDNRGNR